MENFVENAIARQMDFKNSEKSYTDKVLAKSQIVDIAKYMAKQNLNREELHTLMHLVNGEESKLANMPDYHRYIMTKYYVWVREFFRLTIILHDYTETKKKSTNMDERTLVLHEQCRKLMENNLKFLLDFYCQVNRTSLSVDGDLIHNLTQNKMDIQYKQNMSEKERLEQH